MVSANSPYAPKEAAEDRTRALLFEKVTVGIVTTLPMEFAAAKTMLDMPVEYSARGEGAGQDYVLGEIPAKGGGAHTVALMYTGMGHDRASLRMMQMLTHCPQIHSVIMVGIAAGVAYP